MRRLAVCAERCNVDRHRDSIDRFLSDEIARIQPLPMENLKTPTQLDVTSEPNWETLSQQLDRGNDGLFSGVVICECTMVSKYPELADSVWRR